MVPAPLFSDPCYAGCMKHISNTAVTKGLAGIANALAA